MKQTIPPNPEKSFTDGYLDGFHSLKKGVNPAIPAHAIPAGKTPYQHGFELGRSKAQEQMGISEPRS